MKNYPQLRTVKPKTSSAEYKAVSQCGEHTYLSVITADSTMMGQAQPTLAEDLQNKRKANRLVFSGEPT